eukprot:TRINITY_DN28696_c0_g1_i1.p2 TRINITY_DN28696_c0_g1~~TRINITY_DN28696_c0_g1_i1.p2  ORF type:complete len:163 (+),score=45.34 TRINITY_DN28696_c0_g1_i1:60-491(+)
MLARRVCLRHLGGPPAAQPAASALRRQLRGCQGAPRASEDDAGTVPEQRSSRLPPSADPEIWEMGPTGLRRKERPGYGSYVADSIADVTGRLVGYSWAAVVCCAMVAFLFLLWDWFPNATFGLFWLTVGMWVCGFPMQGKARV